MPTYYRCDGVVSTVGNGTNQGLKCSTGWLQVDEPVYTLISYEQGTELANGFVFLICTILVFKLLMKIK